jgi:hypothetical protein
MLRLKRNLARLPPVQHALMPAWDDNMLKKTYQSAQAAWEKRLRQPRRRYEKSSV